MNVLVLNTFLDVFIAPRFFAIVMNKILSYSSVYKSSLSLGDLHPLSELVHERVFLVILYHLLQQCMLVPILLLSLIPVCICR